jgi:N-acetylglucosamine-6-phosphate deacetylase
MTVAGVDARTDEPVTLTLADGRIISRTPTVTAGATLGGDDFLLTPGFIDLQVNGYGGYDLNPGIWTAATRPMAETLHGLRAHLAHAGTTTFFPTLITNDAALLEEALSAMVRALDESADLAAAIPGFHLEGPFLSPDDGPRGAHPRAFIRDPDPALFDRLQDAARGKIRILTLAPERPGALALIERLCGQGVLVALGHTDADAATIHAAVRAGARLSTHLGNGCRAQMDRHGNVLWPQLADDGLTATIIADGHHLPPDVLAGIARAKGDDRLVLVSDAVALGGLPAGSYGDGRFTVAPSGSVTLTGTPYLAGAGHLLDTGVVHAARCARVPLGVACGWASAAPARLLGLGDHKGALVPGFDADIAVLRRHDSGTLRVAATIAAGALVAREGLE